MALTAQQKKSIQNALGLASKSGFQGGYGGSGVAEPQAQLAKVKPIEATRPSQNLLQKIGAVATQAFHIGEHVVGTGVKYVGNVAKDVGAEFYHLGKTPVNLIAATYDVTKAKEGNDRLIADMQKASRDYRAGKLSKADYQQRIKDVQAGLEEVRKINQSAVDRTQTLRDEALDALWAPITILSGGSYIAARVAFNPVKNKLIQSSLFKVGTALEDAVAKIPAVRDLIKRNANSLLSRELSPLAGEAFAQTLKRNSKQVAVGLLIKRPILYQTNVALGQDFYNGVIEGDYDKSVKSAAWIAAQMVSGGPIGWFFRTAGKGSRGLRTLAHGKGSFMDGISKYIGDKNPLQIANFVKNNPKTERVWKYMQEVNLRSTNDDADAAVDNFLAHYMQNEIPLQTLTPAQITRDMERWAVADGLAIKLSKEIHPDKPVQFVAVRWDAATKFAVARKILQAGDDKVAMMAALEELASRPGVAWSSNRVLANKLAYIVEKSKTAKEAAERIRAIGTASVIPKGVGEATKKQAAKLGYTFAEPYGGRLTPVIDPKDTRKLISAAANGSDIFDEAIDPNMGVSGLSRLLNKFGLSPEANNEIAFNKLAESVTNSLQSLKTAERLGLAGTKDPIRGGKYMLSRLQRYVNAQRPNPYLNVLVGGRRTQSALQDIRQMNSKEIIEALPGISEKEARAIKGALAKAYSDVPLEFRGLGPKAIDLAYRIPGFRAYSRIQGALRYTYNPFFALQEIFETKTLAKARSNNLLWRSIGGTKKELDRVSKLLDDSRIFTQGYTGEATQDLIVGRIHANLLQTQKRDLAGMAMDIARKKGLTVEEMVQQFPDELADALRVIVQYPHKGILNSPLARTLNVAMFPMRYNLKVATLAAQTIAKLPPSVQVATIHSLLNFSDWLKSEEGIRWQSENSDVIQIFNYFSIVNNVTSVLQRLRGRPASVGEMGLLGGLPFGAISQILEKEGLIHLNTPYVNPKTGEVVPEYIPITSTAKAAVALEGLLNSMFTYPGRLIGLPGKGAEIRELSKILIKTNAQDFEKVLRDESLTPLQRKWVQVLSNPNVTQDEIDELFVSPAPGEFQWYTLPPMGIPEPVKVTPKPPKTSRGRRTKKKALAIPPPGGQL